MMKRKKMWKKMTALAMAAILIAPVATELGHGAAIVEAAGTNLMSNGDFDTEGGAKDVAGWTIEKDVAKLDTKEYFADGGFDNQTTTLKKVTPGNASATVVSDPKDSNNYCVMAQATAHGELVGCDINGLTAGETYRVSFRLYADVSSDNQIQAMIINRGTGGNATYHLLGGKHNSTAGVGVKASVLKTNEWVTYSCDVTASDDLTYWTLRFYLGGTNAWYIDDISVKHVSEYAENGGFDANADGWSKSTESMTWGAAYGNGDGGVQVTNTAVEQWIRTYVPVTGGQSYNFSYWFKCTDGSNTRIYTTIIQRAADKATKTYATDYTYYNNNVGKNATANSYLIAGTLKPDATWRNVVGQFTAAPETVYAEVRIRICNATGTISFDDFSFTGLAQEEKDGVVLSGSDYAMKLSNDNTASYSGLTLRAGKKYEYSYEVSSDSTLTKALLTVGSQELSAASGIFTYADGAVGLKTAGTGVAYFDNIVIREHTHVDTAPADEVCDTCGENLHQHTMSGWVNDGTNHWKECTQTGCTYRENEGACSGGTATCTTKAICTTCGLEYGDVLGHDMSGWKNDGTNHWKECQRPGCLHKENEGTCDGGTATCTDKAVCTTCGLEHGDILGHDMSDWNNDGTNHWKECQRDGCLYKEGEGQCSGGMAACTSKALCSVCGLEHGHVLNHDMSGWMSDGTNHWKECQRDGCLYREDEGQCSGGTATCLAKAMCDTCGLEHGSLAEHNMSEYINDGTKHWKECTQDGCEHATTPVACDGGTASCHAKAVCSECQKEYGDFVHAFTKQVVKAATLKSEATTFAPAVYYKSCECGEISDTETFQYGNKLEEENEEVIDKAPAMGDSVPAIWLYVMIMSAGVIVFCIKKKVQEMK